MTSLGSSSETSPPLTENYTLNPSSETSGAPIEEPYGDDSEQTADDYADPLRDLYDLRYISEFQEEDSSSFLLSYACGEWDPHTTPEVPQEFRSSLGLLSTVISQNELQTSKKHQFGPPETLQSVEEAHCSYQDSLPSQISPVTNMSSVALKRISGATSNKFAHEFQATIMTHDVMAEASTPSSLLLSHPHTMSRVSLDAVRRFEQVGFFEPPMPLDEEARRIAISRYLPFRQTPDINLDRILRLTKLIFENAAITLVDTDYVHVILPDSDPIRVPRKESMCGHTILIRRLDEPMIINDTSKDWRFKGNPTIMDTWAIRFYAGHPLRTPDGYNLGTICLLDSKPRTFGGDEKAKLLELSGMVIRELESQQKQRADQLREHMQQSIDDFSNELDASVLSLESLIGRLVYRVTSTLSLEKVFWIDATTSQSLRPCPATPESFKDNSAPSFEEMQKRETVDTEEIAQLLRSNACGLLYNPGDPVPPILSRLLPEDASASAFFLLARSLKEPLAIIVGYAVPSDYRFIVPPSTITYFKAMAALVTPATRRKSLSQADRAKVDFIANISHELRTPLHGVLASCELLKESSLSEAQLSLLDTAKSCASGLADTLNHVLDFTKASKTHGKVAELREPVDLAQLVEETMITSWLGGSTKFRSENEIGEIYAPPSRDAGQRTIEPLIEIEPLGNWAVSVDKSGLRRILLNLIGNSLKFTPQGGFVKITLRAGAFVDPDTQAADIIIEDSGCGISETFIRERLFHPFSQERPLSQGTGLGLALVRSILRSPGVDGTIDVHSKLGVGTRMTIRIKAPIIKTPVSGWKRVPKRISLPSLAIRGFETISEGLEMAAENLRKHLNDWYGTVPEVGCDQAELLIVDYDNIDKEMFRKSVTHDPLILLLCSAPIDAAVFKEAQEYNETRSFCYIIIKPYGPHALSRALTAALDASSREGTRKINLPSTKEVSTLGQQVLNLPNTSRAKSFSDLRVLIMDDNPVNLSVMSTFLERRGCYFAKARDGLEGIARFKQHHEQRFHICLMDLQMPNKDGFKAAREIRQIEHQKEIPAARRLQIYALTGLASPEDRQSAIDAGFDGYLVKPLSFTTLEDILKSTLKQLSD